MQGSRQLFLDAAFRHSTKIHAKNAKDLANLSEMDALKEHSSVVCAPSNQRTLSESKWAVFCDFYSSMYASRVIDLKWQN